MLGKKASVRQIEDQALVLMDLDNRAITATLNRLAGEEAEDEESEDEAPKAESKKKASVKARLAHLRRLAAEADGEEAEDEESEDEAPESKKKASRFAAFMDEEAEELEEAALKNTPSSYKKRDCGMGTGPWEGAWSAYHQDYDKCYSKFRSKEASQLDRLRRLASSCESCGEYEHELLDEMMLEEMLAEEELADEPEFMDEEMMLESMLKAEHMGKYARLNRRAGEEEAEDEEAEEEAPKAESKKKAAWGEHEQELLESMMAEEGMMPEQEAEDMPVEAEEEILESMLGDDFGGDFSEDPMGVVDVEMTPDERFLMAKLFGGKKAAEEKPEGEDEVESEDEAPAESKKKASFRPQPRKPANGVTRLGGGVTKEASASNDLSKLWDSAPDVSKYF
jgi:hypothetical protein